VVKFGTEGLNVCHQATTSFAKCSGVKARLHLGALMSFYQYFPHLLFTG